MKASVIGAGGYAGGELLRLVLGHPHLHLVQATSRRYDGHPLGRAHPNLRHHDDIRFTQPDPDQLEPVDIAFVALPKGELATIHRQVAGMTRVVVDLGPDFRDPTSAARSETSAAGSATSATGPGVSAAGPGYVTGLPELYRSELAGATRISVPGCMATAAVVALAPLAAAGLVDGDVIVDARTGSSGAGVAPSEAGHHPERQHALRVYRAAGHRHEAEISRICGVRARMTVTAVPLVRGVQVILYVRPPRPVSLAQVREVFRDRYAAEPFVRLVAHRAGVHRLPDPQFLTGSNFVDVGFEVDDDGQRVVVVVALDNLMKGAAGGAVQSLNAAAGLSERSGLEFPGLHPV